MKGVVMVNAEFGAAVSAALQCGPTEPTGALPVPQPLDLDRDGSVLDRLDEIAALLPGHLAVTSADGALTHAGLRRRVRALADELDAVLPGPVGAGGPAG